MKNTCAMLLPVIVFLTVAIVVSVRYSLFNVVTCYALTDTEPMAEQVERLYENDNTYVTCKIGQLYYTGYDYLQEDKICGAYYYCFEDEQMLIFLLSTKKQPADTIHERTVKGRIIRDEATAEHIISGMAEKGNISMDMLEGFYNSYVISEPDFPYVYTQIAYIILVALAAVYVFVCAYLVNVWMHPYKHAQAKKLRVFGTKSAVIRQLNNEMYQTLYFQYHGVSVTENFLIYSRIFSTDVIRLDDVRYLSKNLVEERGRKEIYRLTLSEPATDLFYEIDFKKEEMIDACVAAIRGS